jgi:imidazole glycerol-phosphate synthase subunit HisH
LIAIVDYKMGNLASVKGALKLLGSDAVVESDPDKLANYDKIILPGVGAYGDAMEHLKDANMDEAVKSYAQSGKWMLGICLGMQLLFDKSEEFGDNKGLGLIPGEVKAFDTSAFETELKVPHMGWNKLFAKHHSPLFKDLDESFYLYFVHSFHVVTEDKYSIGTTHYGYDFTSAVQKDNILGFQPHPEKSHDNGLKILDNFIKLT